MEESNESQRRGSGSHKRNIQPQQLKNKGIARIMNGPKKNAIVKRVAGKSKNQQKLEQKKKELGKSANVYDRLYNSKPNSVRPKTNSQDKLKIKQKMVENDKLNKRRNTPTNSDKNKVAKTSYHQYTGIVTHGHRSRALVSDQIFFSLEREAKSETQELPRKRQPTPVTNKNKKFESESKDHSFLTSQANGRAQLYGSDEALPRFASEAPPSLNSHLSENVDSHGFTDIDDFDFEDNISHLVL